MKMLLTRFAREESGATAIEYALIAAGMAVDQDLPVICVTDRKARLAIVMSRAARHPAAADFPPPEGLGNGLSVHDAPRRRSA